MNDAKKERLRKAGKLLSGEQISKRSIAAFQEAKHDWNDPSAWQALYFDRSIPFDDAAKATYVRQCQSFSRQFILPVVRPLARFGMILVTIFKIFFPNLLAAPKLLHYLIYLGQKYFVSPEANYLILRHFHVGTRIIRFLAANLHTPSDHGKLKPLEPLELEDIYRLDLYLQHDINLFNFVLALNMDMRNQRTHFTPAERLNTSMIELGDFGIRDLPNRWHNFLDAETAIEIYTPIFALFLRDIDFWRSAHSLQFDETFAIYIARVLGTGTHLSIANNKHPMSPRPGYEAAWRLVLRAISSEYLYGMLAAYKRRDENPSQGLPLTFLNELIFNK